MKITIEATVNCVWIELGQERVALPTTDIAKIEEALRLSLRDCGRWTFELHPYQVLKPAKEPEPTGAGFGPRP